MQVATAFDLLFDSTSAELLDPRIRAHWETCSTMQRAELVSKILALEI